jgi:hypothetical protein
MSTTEDTSAIDEKKAEDSGTTSPDFKGFISNYISSILFTIGISIFIIGGLGLYTSKVAQANILPDNIEEAPFTVIDRIVKDIPIDMNIMRPSFFTDNKSTLSQKAMFDSQEYLDSFNKSFLCSLKKSADPNAGLFANAPLYFSYVYDNLVAKNFLAINSIFFYISYLPESAIMFLYGLFGIFLWIGLYFFNFCISIFYHILNIPQLFRTVSEQNDKKWESMESISFFRFMKLILFFFLWIPIGTLSAFIVPIFFTLYGLIAPLYATYEFKQSNKKLNIFDFIKDTFAYKKFFFFILATLSLVTNGIKFLGTNSIIGIIIAVVFAYFMGLYSNEMPESGKDGFSFKIRSTIKQSPVLDINLQNAKLVEICNQIPLDDEKIEKIIQNGKFRPITQTKEVGGDIDNGDDMESPIMISTNPSTPPLQPVIENDMSQNLQSEASAPPLPNNEKMIGGKKSKTYKNKYNIRWT